MSATEIKKLKNAHSDQQDNINSFQISVHFAHKYLKFALFVYVLPHCRRLFVKLLLSTRRSTLDIVSF